MWVGGVVFDSNYISTKRGPKSTTFLKMRLGQIVAFLIGIAFLYAVHLLEGHDDHDGHAHSHHVHEFIHDEARLMQDSHDHHDCEHDHGHEHHYHGEL